MEKGAPHLFHGWGALLRSTSMKERKGVGEEERRLQSKDNGFVGATMSWGGRCASVRLAKVTCPTVATAEVSRA